jgi:long-chain acyl-CoA synthetase
MSASTMAELSAVAAQRHDKRPAQRYKRDGVWQDTSFAELGATVDELALGLATLGIQNGDRVCVFADTSPEWTAVGLAIWSLGAVVVPIYPTNSAEECKWVAGNSEAKVVLCGNADQRAKVDQVREALSALEHVVAFAPDGDLLTLDALRDRGRAGDTTQLSGARARVKPPDASMFIYTSGTTGPPKGCVLSHGSFAQICASLERVGLFDSDDSTYLYLPLAHVFAQLIQISSLDVGGCLIYFGGDAKRIVPELSETRPTVLPSVPRIFEKLHAAASADADPDQLARAVDLGVQVREAQERGEAVAPELQAAFDVADAQLFTRVRALFGGAVRRCVSGAAPIAADVLRFFYACGIPVLEGYGMTETTGAATLNRPGAMRIGTVGRALPGAADVRTAEDGEIEIGGAVVFREYWRNPEATAETFTPDGWLKTGDLGAIDEDGYLSITGRKKDIIITAGGKNLAPANLENDLKTLPLISQAVMYGDRRPYPVAIVTLDPDEIGAVADKLGLPADAATLASSEELRALIQAHLDTVNAGYAQVEQIKRFAILDHDLSTETGELTPTLKVKRNVVYERYADVFDSLYR